MPATSKAAARAEVRTVGSPEAAGMFDGLGLLRAAAYPMAGSPAFVPLPDSKPCFGGASHARRPPSAAPMSNQEIINALELEAVAAQMALRAAQLHAAAEEVEKVAEAARVKVLNAKMEKAMASLKSIQVSPWSELTPPWQYDTVASPGFAFELSKDSIIPEQPQLINGQHHKRLATRMPSPKRVEHTFAQLHASKNLVAKPAEVTRARSKNKPAVVEEDVPLKLVPDEERTTVMLRNIPNNHTRQMLQEILDMKGFSGRYDFLYLPKDFRSAAGRGYAFVNLVSHADAEDIFAKFQGFSEWKGSSKKVCEVAWGHPLQGFEAHVERYRNSPVMHKDLRPEFKPAIFKNGVEVPFPQPTEAVLAPWNKRGKEKGPAAALNGMAQSEGHAPDGLLSSLEPLTV